MIDTLLPPLINLLSAMIKRTKRKLLKKQIKSLINVMNSSLEENIINENIFSLVKNIQLLKMPGSFKNIFDSVIIPVMNIFSAAGLYQPKIC